MARNPKARDPNAQAAARAKRPGRVLNLLPSRNAERDWDFGTAVAAGALRSPRLPAEVDLRERWWRVADQGETGSCVGWATADGVFRQALVRAGRLATAERLSVRFVWMASKETDGFTTRPESFIEEAGTSLKTACDVARKFGLVTEKELPFEIRTRMFAGSQEAFYASAAKRRIASYFNLRRNLGEWRRALAAGHAILAGLDVDRAFRDAAATKGRLDKRTPGTGYGGHAVCIVGYRADGRFILRNSWGSAWGDRGFAYAAEPYIAEGFFGEAYIVTL
jgi:hypothetical protein